MFLPATGHKTTHAPEKFPLDSLSLSSMHASPGPSPGSATPPDLFIDRGIAMSRLEFGIILRGLLGMQDARTVCPRNMHTPWVVGLLILALSGFQPTQPPTRTPHHTGNPPLSGGRARAFALFLFLVEVDAGQKERSIVVTYPVNQWRRGERRAASRRPQLLICCICADMRCKTNHSTRYQHVQTGHAQTGHARR
jgi:hypothetical protein